MREARCIALLLGSAGLGLGCASAGLPLEELPSQPIALVYWSPEDARRRAEVLEDARRPRGARRGVARVGDLGEVLVGRGGRDDLAAQLARWPGRLSLLDPRTGSLTRVEAAAAGSRPVAWSPDHRRLMFQSGLFGERPQLREVDLDNGEVRALTYGDEAHPRGDYGPGGAWVWVGVRRLGRRLRGRVYVQENPRAQVRVLAEGGVYEAPRFAPDGRSVLYLLPPPASPRARGRQVAPLLITRGLAPGAVERELGRGRDPVYTPGGEWIVYSARAGSRWQLRRMRPDGSGKSPIGAGSRDETAPAVSPDGRHVIYVGEEGGIDRLFVRRLDGSGDRILLGDGAVAWPVW